MTTHTRGMDPHEPLDAVLRAATAPGYMEELAGEQQAVAAFRAAGPVPRRRSLLARVLTVKALVVGAVAASTGVVLATAGGVLPLLPVRETPAIPPAPPAATNPASAPAVPPPDGPRTTSSAPATGQTTPPSSPGKGPPCEDCAGPDGEKPDHNKPPPGRPDHDRPAPGKDKDDDGDHEDIPPPTEAPTPPAPPTDDTQTPGSPAQGAVTAVPPSGAQPPSPGG